MDSLAIPMRVGCWCGFGFHGLTILPNGADIALHPACTFVCRPCTPTRLGTVRGNGLIVPAHAYLGCRDQSPCVLEPRSYNKKGPRRGPSGRPVTSTLLSPISSNRAIRRYPEDQTSRSCNAHEPCNGRCRYQSRRPWSWSAVCARSASDR